MPDDTQFGNVTGDFGSDIRNMFGGPNYTRPDPNTDALDQSANLLQQRVKRANDVATNPLAEFFAPEQAAAARDFVPKATEQLQQIQMQRQNAADMRQKAINGGLRNPNQFGPQTTDTTLAEEAIRQWKDEGNFNAYRMLKGASPEWGNRADLYMPDAMAKFGQHVDAVNKGIQALDNAASSPEGQSAFNAARVNLIKSHDLDSLGIKESQIPKTIVDWDAARGPLNAMYKNAERTLKSFTARQDQLNQAVPVTDEKVAGRIEGNYQFSNGEAVPGFKAVSLPGYGDVQGVMGPPGSRDTTNRGVTWSNAAPEQIKTVREQLGADEVKGAIGKYKMSRDFYNTASNDKLYKSAAGLALISDELGAIGRDVAEGSKAAGSLGLTKMLETKYGTVDKALNAIKREHSALKAWLGEPPEAQNRLSPPSIQGIKDVAQFKHDEALRELGDRISQPLETAGRYGMMIRNLGLDKEVVDNPELRSSYDNALRAGNREIDSYPMVAIGDRRVMLPTGSNVPGAKPMPLDHGPSEMPSVGAKPSGPAPPGAATRPEGTLPPSPQGAGPGSGTPALSGTLAPNGTGVPNQPVAPPSGGPTPGRNGLPPGMTLDNPAALDAAANRTMQIESGFKPGQKTGSYVGLGQWSQAEMKRHGITNPDDVEQNRTALKADIQERAAKLQKDGLPVTASNVYLMHQQGVAGLEAHLKNPDGLAWENVRFGYKNDAIAKRAIWGNMTPEMRNEMGLRSINDIDKVTSGDFTKLWEARYNNTDQATRTPAAAGRAGIGLPAEPSLNPSQRTAPRFDPDARPGIMDAVKGMLFGRDAEAANQLKGAAIENAPAIGGVTGAVVGGVAGGPPGAVAGGGAGGATGQSLKDYLQGNDQSAGRIAKAGAINAVLGVAPAGRPIAGFLARTLGVGGIEGGAEALKPGSDVVDIGEAALKGVGIGLAGEALGRFVSSAGSAAYRVLSRYTTAAQHALSVSAGKLAEARQAMVAEKPKLPDGSVNPKFEAAEKQADDATTAIKDHGQNPDDMVHAYEQAAAGVSAGEAAVLRKAESEKTAVSKGYQQLEKSVKETGVGAPKPGQPLPDGPLAQIRTAENPTGKVEAKFAPDAQHAETLMKAQAKDWGEKWGQLQDAGTELIKKRLDFIKAGDKVSAKAMDDIFVGVRNQQKAAAEYVFGPKTGAQKIAELENLDQRYAKIMTATQGMSFQKMQSVLASGNTPARRELEKNFRAFAGDDPGAMRAFNAMKAGANGDWKAESTLMGSVIAGEVATNLAGIPTLGGISAVTAAGIGGHRLYKIVEGWMNAKLLGKAAKFADFAADEVRSGRVPGMVGNAAQRGIAGYGTATESPPVPGARIGKDAQGNDGWFVPDPSRPGKHMQVTTH